MCWNLCTESPTTTTRTHATFIANCFPTNNRWFSAHIVRFSHHNSHMRRCQATWGARRNTLSTTQQTSEELLRRELYFLATVVGIVAACVIAWKCLLCTAPAPRAHIRSINMGDSEWVCVCGWWVFWGVGDCGWTRCGKMNKIYISFGLHFRLVNVMQNAFLPLEYKIGHFVAVVVVASDIRWARVQKMEMDAVGGEGWGLCK